MDILTQHMKKLNQFNGLDDSYFHDKNVYKEQSYDDIKDWFKAVVKPENVKKLKAHKFLTEFLGFEDESRFLNEISFTNYFYGHFERSIKEVLEEAFSSKNSSFESFFKLVPKQYFLSNNYFYKAIVVHYVWVYLAKKDKL